MVENKKHEVASRRKFRALLNPKLALRRPRAPVLDTQADVDVAYNIALFYAEDDYEENQGLCDDPVLIAAAETDGMLEAGLANQKQEGPLSSGLTKSS